MGLPGGESSGTARAPQGDKGKNAARGAGTPRPCSLRMGEGLVELEELGDAVGFGDGGGEAVGGEDGAVVRAVGREEVGGHGLGSAFSAFFG